MHQDLNTFLPQKSLNLGLSTPFLEVALLAAESMASGKVHDLRNFSELLFFSSNFLP